MLDGKLLAPRNKRNQLGTMSSKLLFSVMSLFTSGEQGLIYDNSQLSSLFQDAAGTTPAVVDGIVGLSLDTRFGLIRGPEQLTDPEFDDASKWFITVSAPATATISGGKATLVSPAGEQSSVVTVAATATVGKCYEFTLDVESYTGSAGVHFSGAGATAIPAGTGIKRIIMFADGTLCGIKRIAACNIVVRSMTVREIPGTHRIQATTSSKPILRSAGGLYWLEYDGVDDFLATGSTVNFSASNTITVCAAVRKLSDAAIGTIIELTTSGDTLDGGFWIRGPSGAAVASYQGCSRGNVAAFTSAPATLAAPVTNVISAQGNISTDTFNLRANGAQYAAASTDQGAGNYANAVLYFGRRAGTTLPFNGREYYVMVRGTSVTPAQLTGTERVAGIKCGLNF